AHDENKHKEALEIFENLRKARLPHNSKIDIRAYDTRGGEKVQHSGVVRVKRSGFGFLIIDGTGYDIFFPAENVQDDMWDAIREGDRVRFAIGYAFKGPQACNIHV
ncbi:cold-shock protein, partial [Methylophaga sp. UBA3996]|uniref:cold-shock protein n=1 Tax=Methylophaga sp. UBA3996 TaxID=1946891 RepID=UPI0025A09A9D